MSSEDGLGKINPDVKRSHRGPWSLSTILVCVHVWSFFFLNFQNDDEIVELEMP